MKTAMTLLYDELEKLREITTTISLTDLQRMIGNLYLETEKQQIIDAYWEGKNNGFATDDEYYTSTFSTNKATLK